MKDFWSNRDGNFAIMTAIAAPVLIAFIALAVDSANFFKTKRDLSDAADAALIFGAKKYEEVRDLGRTPKQAENAAKRIASQAFTDQNKSEYGRVVRKLSYVESNGQIVGDIEYSYDAPFYFRGILTKKKKQKITDTSEIIFGRSESDYIDLTLVLDNSASLGMGSSPADQRLMQSVTGCTFACHVPRESAQTARLPEVARATGAELRLDVMKDAAVSALRDLQSEITDDEKVRVSIYTFSNYFQTLTEPTTDLGDAIRDIRNLDFADETTTPENVFGGTNVGYALKELEKALENRKSKDRRKDEIDRTSYVVLFTDGVENDTHQKYENEELLTARAAALPPNTRQLFIDRGLQDQYPQYFETIPGSKKYTLVLEDPNWVPQGDSVDFTQIFNPKSCEPVKSDGHTLIAIQTFYDVTPELKSFPPAKAPGEFIESRQKKIADRFISCASGEENYYLTKDADDMTQKFKDAILSTLGNDSQLRLTQ